MGRPIKKKFIGDQKNNTQTHYITCSAWVTGDTQSRNGVILRQKTSNRYKVSTQTAGGPSTTTGFLCKLVNGVPSGPGQMSIYVDPYVTPTSAGTFVVHMEIDTATLASAGGGTTPYQVNDVLTVVGGTGTAATLTVNTVSAGGVATFTVTTRGNYTVLPTNPVTVTDSPTTGAAPAATFNLKYRVVTGAGGVTGVPTGTGYGANSKGYFTGGGFTSAAADSVTVGSGIITAVSVSTQGSGYTSIPTFYVDSFGATDYANKINNRTVETFGDKKYKWELGVTGAQGAGTPNGPTSEGTGTLGYALIQSV